VRLSRLFSSLTLLLLLCQFAVLTTPAAHRGRVATIFPTALTQAFAALRERLLASPLAVDTSPTPEQARRDFVALWADLETSGRP
jgi:hypothetical protein